jgi:hypothetical protein
LRSATASSAVSLGGGVRSARFLPPTMLSRSGMIDRKSVV